MRITGESSGERFEFGYLRRLGGIKSSRDLVKKGLEIPEHDSMIAKEMRILTQGGQVVTFARLHVISRAPQFCLTHTRRRLFDSFDIHQPDKPSRNQAAI